MRASTLAWPLAATLLLAACGADPLSPEGLRAARKPAPGHTPVLFVHGYNASATTWTTMVGRFKKDGWKDAELATFSYNTSQSNVTTAGIIAQKVDSIRNATGSAKVDIVTHSMGALSARYYVKYLGGDAKVDGFVSLGGANHGTTTAQLCFQTSCREMWPNSSFLVDLNAGDETPGALVRYATWWSPCDEVINPRSSALLSGAVNTQTACMAHSQLHENATVYTQVRDFVNQPVTVVVM